jgi:hypothetical protein
MHARYYASASQTSHSLGWQFTLCLLKIEGKIKYYCLCFSKNSHVSTIKNSSNFVSKMLFRSKRFGRQAVCRTNFWGPNREKLLHELESLLAASMLKWKCVATWREMKPEKSTVPAYTFPRFESLQLLWSNVSTTLDLIIKF